MDEEIDCVILDLTMSHMDGEETFREMLRVQSDVRVIISSGYNSQDVTQRFIGKGLLVLYRNRIGFLNLQPG